MTEEGHGQAEAGRRNGVEIKQREVWSGGDAADLLFFLAAKRWQVFALIMLMSGYLKGEGGLGSWGQGPRLVH